MKPIIFGHRGVPKEAPENSLKSFSLIKKYQIQGVELDIHLTEDKILIVHHDFNTKKLTGVDLEISENSYTTLSKLDIGEGEHIPKLEEVFELLGRDVYYDLEVKSRGQNRKDLSKKLVKLIIQYNLEERVFVSSFDPVILKVFNRVQRDFNLNINTGIIYSKEQSVPILLRNGLGLFLTKNSIIKPEKNQLKGVLFWFYTKILRKKCYTWTSDRKEEWIEAENKGLEGICTNYPRNLLEYQRS